MTSIVASTLADRLAAARNRLMVGRDDALALFASALSADEPPFGVLYLHGPGGIGKTMLMRAFVNLCRHAPVSAVYVDARNIHPSPESFEQAVGAVTAGSRRVVLVDTYEKLAPLDDWLRDCWLSNLDDDVLVVLAGRNPPSLGWRKDPGWQALLRTVAVRNLSTEDSRVYLSRREIPPEQHEAIVRFTHGYPLALTLIADLYAQRDDFQFQPQAAPDLVRALLEQFVQEVSGAAHRRALEACALVRSTTEALLNELLDTSDPHTLFEWLRDLSFIDADAHGVFPHDLAREALVTDLRWRNPDRYAQLHRTARGYYARKLQDCRDREMQHVVSDYLFLHRDSPLMRPFFEWTETGRGVTEPMTPRDVQPLLAMVTQHEGPEARRVAAHWLARQPHNVLVIRDPGAQPLGFLASVNLHDTSPEDLNADPATAGAHHYLDRIAPIRTGERAIFFRFWMERSTYQAVSATQSLIFVKIAESYLTTPGLAFTFFPCADPGFWAPMSAYADLDRLPEVDFEVGGRRYGVYGHDWRAMPPARWLDLLAEREIAVDPLAAGPVGDRLVVLNRLDFDAAVRDALRHFTRPERLATSPLLRSRMVSERVGYKEDASTPADRIAALQALLRTAVQTLEDAPRAAKWHQAVNHTYLRPASTQERAAEQLRMPFSSYRRYLAAGVARIAEVLWRWDLHGRSAD